MSYQPPVKQPKWFPTFVKDLPSMEGKVVLITGTTSGTGSVAAHQVVKLGATLCCLNRPSSRAAAALEKLKEEFPEADINHIDMDLMDFESVRAGTAKIKETYDKVNVVCCNAGVMALEDKPTKDGFDVQMQTNHLSHFLLVKEIFPLLEKAAELDGDARVVSHTSMARYGGPLKPKYFGKNGGALGGNGNSIVFNGARWERYHQTKLANVVFTLALHNKLQAKGSKIKAIAAHPGLAATDLQATTHKDGGMGGVSLIGGTGGFMSFSQSKEDGTMGILKAMCATDAESGKVYGPRGRFGFVGIPKVVKSGKNATLKAQAMLWEESEKAVGEFAV